MAAMAWSRLSFIVVSRSWTVWLFTSLSSLVSNWGSPPHRIWLGDSPVVAFFRSLCTAVAIESQLVQSSGAIDVTIWRYCSIHWFFHSDSPSVRGWKVVEIFCWAPILVANPFLKCEVKRGSLSVMSFLGSPNHG